MDRIEELIESYINGNISYVREEFKKLKIDVIDNSYYVRQYNKNEILIDSLVFGSKQRAYADVKNIINKK
jgi:hypothetical protein